MNLNTSFLVFEQKESETIHFFKRFRKNSPCTLPFLFSNFLPLLSVHTIHTIHIIHLHPPNQLQSHHPKRLKMEAQKTKKNSTRIHNFKTQIRNKIIFGAVTHMWIDVQQTVLNTIMFRVVF